MIKKLLRSILIVSVLSVCLVPLLVYQGSCQDLPKIEILFSPEQGQEILQRLKDTIQNAEGRVYILIYSFTLDELAQTIIEKHREGLDIKVIMDKGQAGSKVTENLRQTGIPLILKAGSKGGYMHIKALIADDTVLTGSYNYSKNATYRNDENFLIIKDKDIVEAHVAKFNQLWGEEHPVVSPEINKEQERAPPCEITVYITKTGTKYHRSGCGYLRESCIAISLIEAVQQGYTPCKVCKPPSSDAYRTHGHFFYRQGQFDAAVKCYDRAIKLNPNSAYLYNDRGMSYKELGNLDKAIGDLSQAIEVWVGFADAYYNRGIAYFQQKRYDQALKDFQVCRYLYSDKQDKLKCEKYIQKVEEIKHKSQGNIDKILSEEVELRGKKLLAAFLLGVGLCLVPSLGYGKIHPYVEENPSFISERLLSARVDYIMCNPDTFLYVVFIYDSTGVLGVSLLKDPEGLIDTKGKFLVHIYDTRDIFSHKSGMALLEQFKRRLEIIYSYISFFASDMNTDIVAKFYNRKKIPLGYFYQGEYHLWEK